MNYDIPFFYDREEIKIGCQAYYAMNVYDSWSPTKRMYRLIPFVIAGIHSDGEIALPTYYEETGDGMVLTQCINRWTYNYEDGLKFCMNMNIELYRKWLEKEEGK